MATQEDRSLPSGMSLPRWMKSKRTTDRFNLDQSTFSPTELDDSFMFYYRNNLPRASTDLSTSIQSSTGDNTLLGTNISTSSATGIETQKRDFSKHTPFCQRYLQNGNASTTAQQVKLFPTVKTKSSGTDDGFKGEAAKCGSSVIRVAHQMVASAGSKIMHNGCTTMMQSATTTPPNEYGGASSIKPPDGFNPALRRGSKSLPTSPLSSPKGQRRNKYFTGAFVHNTTDKQHNGSWILSNLLAKRETLSLSSHAISTVVTESETTTVDSASKVASKGVGATTTTTNNNNGSSLNDLSEIKKRRSIYVPKPSEYREMNFWSPTSM